MATQKLSFLGLLMCSKLRCAGMSRLNHGLFSAVIPAEKYWHRIDRSVAKNKVRYYYSRFQLKGLSADSPF